MLPLPPAVDCLGQCVDDATVPNACLAARDDYFECLHHHKEVRWSTGLVIISWWRVVPRCVFHLSACCRSCVLIVRSSCVPSSCTSIFFLCSMRVFFLLQFKRMKAVAAEMVAKGVKKVGEMPPSSSGSSATQEGGGD